MRKFVRTRAASPQHQHQHQPQPHAQPQRKANGHANGVGAGPSPEQHSPKGGGARPPWMDPHFPAAPSSLGPSRGYSDVLWMRPTELCARPRFRGDGGGAPAEGEVEGEREGEEEEGARWAAEAGALGDGGAGVAVAAAALAPTPRLLDRVVPGGQTFAPQRYSGAFRFRFWVFGAWREVVVDDRLPTRGGRLLGVRCSRPDDFTLPLLEKAYAKLYGGYAALRVGGDGDGEAASRALQDLSGGVVQSFSLRRQARALTLQVLNSALPRSTLVVATVAGERPRHGLLAHQPYCVTGLARVRAPDAADDGLLVRVRSATGRGAWTGPWARGSAQWAALPDADRELLAARAPHAAHFWMPFEEFAASFGRLELVHVGPDDWVAEAALRARRPWRAVLARRRWRRGHNAGGPPRAPTAHANPHFRVAVARACHLVVALAQHYEPSRPSRPPRPTHAIGLAVYEVRPEGGVRALDVTHECRAREVATFFTLPAGQYLVVPHTARAHVDAAFLLRILTDEHTDVWEVNEDNVIVRDVMAEFLADVHSVPPEVRRGVARLLRKSGAASEAGDEGGGEGEAPGVEVEVEMEVVRRALREGGARGVRVSREVCRAMVALRDPQARGAVRAHELPALVALLAFWAAAFRRYGGAGAGAGAAAALAPWAAPRCSSYRLRALLHAAGLTASNKVLECLVLRFADGASLTATDFVLALAHERHRSLEAKIKSNPLSLEEMILMTIYS